VKKMMDVVKSNLLVFAIHLYLFSVSVHTLQVSLLLFEFLCKIKRREEVSRLRRSSTRNRFRSSTKYANRHRNWL
jgi:hypothetical protein